MFTKRIEGGRVKIDFQVILTSTLSVDTIWRQLEQSLVDSEKTWLWPGEHSVMHAEQGRLSLGCVLITTYTMGTPDAPQEKQRFTHEYTLAQYDPTERLFEYRAQPEHPFQGGAVVQAVPGGDGGTEIRWSGAYDMPGKYESLGDQFGWYLSVFFGAVEERLRAAERERPS